MRTHVDRRQEQLLELVRQRGRMRVTELAAELGISVITVRRDVENLAGAGRLVRFHGEVAWPDRPSGGDRRDGPLIGMLVPRLPYYFSEIVRGARAGVTELGGRVALAVSAYHRAEERQHVQRMLDAGADGLLLTVGWLEDGSEADEDWLLGLGVPVVLVERHVPAQSRLAGLDRVRTASAEGAAKAVRHLAGLGHQRIALVGQAGPHSGQIRMGFVAALAECDLWRPDGGLVVPVPSGLEEQTRQELELALGGLITAVRKEKVSAALVHSDEVAMGALPFLRAANISVPEDLAIVSYDDEIAELSEIPLSTISPPKREIGVAAAQLVLRRIAERNGQRAAVQHLDLVPELRVRVSCGATIAN